MIHFNAIFVVCFSECCTMPEKAFKIFLKGIFLSYLHFTYLYFTINHLISIQYACLQCKETGLVIKLKQKKEIIYIYTILLKQYTYQHTDSHITSSTSSTITCLIKRKYLFYYYNTETKHSSYLSCSESSSCGPLTTTATLSVCVLLLGCVYVLERVYSPSLLDAHQ